jgi:hypothetical protein
LIVTSTLFGSNRVLLAAVVAATLLAGGCSSKVRLAEVGGTVTKAGKPLPKVWVRFAPAEGGRPAEGRTNDLGRYALDYSRGRQGAPLGQHRVMVMSGGDLDAEGNEISPRRVIFKGEFVVAPGANAIDIVVP